MSLQLLLPLTSSFERALGIDSIALPQPPGLVMDTAGTHSGQSKGKGEALLLCASATCSKHPISL